MGLTKTEETESIPPHAWYENFYRDIVLPRVAKGLHMTEIRTVHLVFSSVETSTAAADPVQSDPDFISWLAVNDPALYNRIEEADTAVNSLWLSRAEKQSFKDACTTWYNLLLEAKKGFDDWKKKQQEAAVLAGRQEGLQLR